MTIYLKKLLPLVCVCFASVAIAQTPNTSLIDTMAETKVGSFKIGGLIDIYAGYNNAATSSTIPYFVTHNRSREVNVNIAFIDMQYAKNRVRARFVPAFGTFINANNSVEPGSLRNIMEATVGYKLSKEKEIWVDVGVLGSPYTNESYVSKDHLMYTRAVAAEYVPYYITGIKLTTQLSPKVIWYTYVLNGWQEIANPNALPALGTQVEYRYNDKNLVNFDTYIGPQGNNSFNDMRYFADLYWIHNLNGKFSFTTCIYTGLQRIANNNLRWGQANFVGRYTFNKLLSLSGRLEYFTDSRGVFFTPTPLTPKGFNVYGGGLCLNVNVAKNVMFRFEGRNLTPVNGLPFGNKDAMWWGVANATAWF